ncbi:MAG: hypothetical protein PHE28_05475, partial [Bacteroidales bacterium]|nr:hypothetical protein [Bacteroidales bacterium]
MKTKNLLFLILILGLSFNSFSQEEVTIKQVIKNSSSSNIKGTNDQISIVEINTSIPVTINKGEENAIFIKGKFNNAEDYIGLCTLDNGLLKINNPKKGKEITLELASDVIVYHFKNANVVVNRDVSVNVSNGMIEADNGIIEVDSNSSAKFNGKVNGNYLYVRSKNNSRLSFASIEALELDVNVGKESEVILKGKSDSLKIDRVEYSKCNIDNFDYTYLYEIEKTNEGVQVSKTESIVYNDDKDAEDSKFIKDTFAYSSLLEAIKLIEGDTITKAEALEEAEYNRLSNSVSHEENVIIGKNARVNITFVDKDKIGKDYVSNYPIKGYENGQLVVQDDYPLDLELTIRKDIGDITIMDGAEVNINSKIDEKERS